MKAMDTDKRANSPAVPDVERSAGGAALAGLSQGGRRDRAAGQRPLAGALRPTQVAV